MYPKSERAERTNRILAATDLKERLKLIKKEYRYSLSEIEAKQKKLRPNKNKIETMGENFDMEEKISLRQIEFSRISTPSSSKNIKDLLMTREEIDIEKVLCLHIASLSVPSICPTSWYDMEKHGTILTRYAKYLPSYLVINTESHKSCTCSCEFCSKRLKRESPVRTFVIVNTQIEMLINTVIEALAQVNEPKLKRLVKYARNVSSIKFLLSKRKNINFIGRIYESLRSLTCYSFRAEICTVIKGTTLLVNEIDKHWKNPVFKIIMPTTFPTYDPLMNNFLSRTRGEDPMLELVESYRAGLVEEGVSPPGQLSHSSSALTVLSADGSEAALLAINPSSHRFIKHLSAILLEWEGATAAGSTRNVLEAILTEPLRLDRPVPTKSTIRLEKELNAIVENSLSDLSLMRKRFCRQRQPVLDAEGVKDRLKSNIVSRLSTPERVLVAKEIGAKKSWDKNANGNLDSRVGLGAVLGRVLSRPSLVELARAAPPQEREFLLKPSAKGGLGIASYIIGDDKMIKLEKATEHRQGVNLISAQDSPPKTESSFDFAVTGDLNLARIRQTILNTEVRKKLDRFLKANKNGN